ncbi:hypothetical protein SLE2022_142950 [Rubroshorea leprosula]
MAEVAVALLEEVAARHQKELDGPLLTKVAGSPQLQLLLPLLLLPPLLRTRSQSLKEKRCALLHHDPTSV